MAENINCYTKYSPDQPRDERGRFGSGGGAAPTHGANYDRSAPPSSTNRPGNGMPHAFTEEAGRYTNDAFGLTADHDSAARNAASAAAASSRGQSGQAARYHRQAAAAHLRVAAAFSHVPAHAAESRAAAAAHIAAANEHSEHHAMR